MQTVCITGVGRGIGKALAQAFLSKGYAVIGTTLSGTADYAHDSLTVFALDLSSRESIAACVRDVASVATPIDILINNSGVLLDEGELQLVPDLLRTTLEVNLIGTAALTEALLPLVAPTGHVIFMDSTAGSLTLASKLQSHEPGHYPAYKISKAALNMYMVTLAKRIGPDGIIVSSVHPGWVRTDMGGAEGEISPEEAAHDIIKFAISRPPTGGFWHNGERLPW